MLQIYAIAAALFLLPESPRWLVVNGRLDEALSVIQRILTGSTLPNGASRSGLHMLTSHYVKGCRYSVCSHRSSGWICMQLSACEQPYCGRAQAAGPALRTRRGS